MVNAWCLLYCPAATCRVPFLALRLSGSSPTCPAERAATNVTGVSPEQCAELDARKQDAQQKAGSAQVVWGRPMSRALITELVRRAHAEDKPAVTDRLRSEAVAQTLQLLPAAMQLVRARATTAAATQLATMQDKLRASVQEVLCHSLRSGAWTPPVLTLGGGVSITINSISLPCNRTIDGRVIGVLPKMLVPFLSLSGI